MNHVILIGRLGKDPELKTFTDGVLTKFSIATDEFGANKEKRTEWHTITCFGKTAEIASKHLHKGSQVSVVGKLRNTQYQDKDGATKYKTEVVAEKIEFLDSKKEDSFQE